MTYPGALQNSRSTARERTLCAIALAVIMLAAGWSRGAAQVDAFPGQPRAMVASGLAAAASNATPAVTPTAAGSSTATATITPVTPVSAPPAIADSGPNNTAKYLVTGVVLASIAVVVGALAVLWFIVD